MRIVKFLLAAITVIVIGMIGFVYLAPEKATIFAINAERHRSDLLRKEIDLPDGFHHVYLEGGKGEPLMLLHGFGANKDNFTKVAGFLTSHYHVIIPDLIGFGESSHPKEADYTPAAQAERIRSFARALGFERLHLGGNSMGGLIAMTYAASYPAEVASLWLLDPAGVWNAPKSEYFKSIEETGRNQLLVKNEDEFAQLIKFVMNKPPFIPRPIMNVMAQEKISNYDLEVRIFKQLMDAGSLENRVSGLSIPTLIVWGDKDRVLSLASAEILHKLMPRSQVITMSDIGHIPMMEQPQQSAEDYLSFRKSL
jgi:pimeloyl-ACP methyl ester carboxylesterase